MSLQMCTYFLPALISLNHFVWNNEYIGDWNDWKYDTMSIAYIVIIAINGSVAVGLSVTGYQYTDATKISWLEYSSLILSVFYQILIFDDIPNLFEIIGIVFITIATMLNVCIDLYKYCKTKETRQKYQKVDQNIKGLENDIDNNDNDDSDELIPVIIV